MIYFTPLLLLIILTLFEITNKNYKSILSLFMTTTLIYLIFISVIRYGMGVDYFDYYHIVNNIKNFNDHNYLEPGFRIIVVLIKKINNDPIVIIGIFALLTLYPLRKILTKYSPYMNMSLFIYFTTFYVTYVFNGIRQGLAMTIFLFSLEPILKKDLKKTLIFTLVGMSVHYSAILILISYFINLKSKNLNKKKTIRLIVILLIFGLFNSQISSLVIKILPQIMTKKFISYSTKFNDGIDITSLFLRILIILPIVFTNISSENKNEWNSLVHIYLFGFILYIIFGTEKIFATRINMFIRLLEIIIIPNFFYYIKNNKPLKLILLMYYISIYTFVFYKSINSTYYYPFISILEK